jgi:hypothetical protein
MSRPDATAALKEAAAKVAEAQAAMRRMGWQRGATRLEVVQDEIAHHVKELEEA